MSMTNLMMAGNTLMQMHTMQSVSTQLQGRANVLKSELKYDKNPSAEKKAQMEELEGRAQDVMGQVMEAAQKTNDDLKQNAVEKDQKDETGRVNEKKDETGKLNEKEKDEEDSKKTVTDRVELSEVNLNFQTAAPGLIAPDSGYAYTRTGSIPQPALPFALKMDITA